MTLYVAGYKAPGTWKDKVVTTSLSFRHKVPVKYSHVELLYAAPIDIVSRYDNTRLQHCIAASKRDGDIVRRKTIFFKKDHWDFAELKDVSTDVWLEAEALIGRPYDTLGALLCVTPFARLHEHKEWCSAMLADIFEWDVPEEYDPHMVMERVRSMGGRFIEG